MRLESSEGKRKAKNARERRYKKKKKKMMAVTIHETVKGKKRWNATRRHKKKRK